MSYTPRSSTNDKKHPYLREGFFLKPANLFWENDLYSEKSKDYFRACAQRQAKEFEYNSKADLIN